MVFNLLLFDFIYFNAILSLYLFFFFLFLLVFVLLVKGKGPRCSDSEFDSCAIYAYVTLLWEGACPVLSWRIIRMTSSLIDCHEIYVAVRLSYQRVILKLRRGIIHAI